MSFRLQKPSPCKGDDPKLGTMEGALREMADAMTFAKKDESRLCLSTAMMLNRANSHQH